MGYEVWDMQYINHSYMVYCENIRPESKVIVRTRGIANHTLPLTKVKGHICVTMVVQHRISVHSLWYSRPSMAKVCSGA